MKIIVQTLKREVFDVEVSEDCTVQDVKEKIASAKQLEPAQIKVVYMGSVLSDDRTMQSYNFVDGHRVVIMIKNSNKPQEVKPKSKPKSSPKAVRRSPVGSPKAVRRSTIHDTVDDNDNDHDVDIEAESDDDYAPPLVNSLYGQVGSINDIINYDNDDNDNNNDSDNDNNDVGENLFTMAAEATMNGSLEQTIAHVQQNMQEFIQILLQNPQIQQMQEQNPEEFNSMFTNPNFLQNVLAVGSHMENMANMDNMGNMDENYENIDQNQIPDLSDEDVENLNYLVGLGVPYNDALQFYLVNNRNKEDAATMFFNSNFDTDANIMFFIENQDQNQDQDENLEPLTITQAVTNFFNTYDPQH